MKLFMKSYYEKTAREVKPPLENEFVCISCAGKLGGKVDRWLKMKWSVNKCDVCGHKTEVTTPTEYVWR
jgi:transcription elongation factor Elf1